MQKRPYSLSNSLKLSIIAAVILALLFTSRPTRAAIGWVGDMLPAGGSTTPITTGGSLSVHIQVYKAGVTDSSGQGANITCTLHWSTVPYFGGSWSSTTDTPMSYNTDIGNNDEYVATISPGVGLYEFTASCTDTTDSDTQYQGAGNGQLVVDTASGTCNTGTQGDNNVFWSGLGHDSFSTAYRTPFGAVPDNQGTVTLKFRTCMDDLDALPQIRVYNDRTNAESILDLDFDSHDSDASLGGVTYWTKDVSIPTNPTILYYVFHAADGTNTAYYRDDDPEFTGGGWGQGESDQTTAYDNSYQLTVYNQNFATPAWLQNAVIYQIFPDRFRNGDTANDPVQGGDWIYGDTVRKHTWLDDLCDPRAACPGEWSNQFYGGDLQGIIDELDYLQSIGVTALYLNPIFEAPSNHLYDTQDYLSIDTYFGDLAAFQTLASEAEARGIKIILDGVFNHVSSDSYYFDRYNRWDASGNLTSPSGPGTNDQSGACESTASEWRAWFTFFADPSNKCYDGTPGSQTMSYYDWAGYDSLAKLVSNNTAVRNYIYDGGAGSVARYWLNAGADGWRFDVGGDVDVGTATGDSNGYWAGYRSASHTQYASAALLGEEWGDSSAWLVGDQWDSVMNYRFRSAVLNWMFDSCTGNGCTSGTKFEDNDSNDASSSGPIEALSVSAFDNRLTSIREDYPAPAWYAMMNLMGSHDTNRVLFLLKKISSDDANAALDKFKFLGLFQFTYPGAPTLYYGDEVALAPDGVWDSSNLKWEDDPYNRAPFPWTDEGRTPDTDMQAHFRKLAVLRSQYAALQTGDFTTLLTDDANQVYAYARTTGTTDLAVIALNRDSAAAHSVSVTGLNVAFNGTTLYDVMNCSGAPVVCPSYTVSGGGIAGINVPALSGAILVEGPLPAYSLSLSITDDDLAAGGNTSIVATVTNLGGELAADGTLVAFTQQSGAGGLSSGSALVSGGSGQASVTYNAPATGQTVTPILAVSGSYAGAADTGTVYVGYPVDVVVQDSQVMGIGPATLDATGTVGVWVQKTGNGEPIVTAAQFTGNPAGGADPYQGQMNTDYVDVHLSSATDISALEIRVDCDGTCNGDEGLWWWDDGSSRWRDFESSGQTGGATGYIWGRATLTTTFPSLADLTGTPLAGGNVSPTVVAVRSLTASPGKMPWGALALATGVLLAAASLWRGFLLHKRLYRAGPEI